MRLRFGATKPGAPRFCAKARDAHSDLFMGSTYAACSIVAAAPLAAYKWAPLREKRVALCSRFMKISSLFRNILRQPLTMFVSNGSLLYQKMKKRLDEMWNRNLTLSNLILCSLFGGMGCSLLVLENEKKSMSSWGGGKRGRERMVSTSINLMGRFSHLAGEGPRPSHRRRIRTGRRTVKGRATFIRPRPNT